MLSSVSTTQTYFVLRFPILLWVSPLLLIGNFARHGCWHRNFQLSTSGFHCELEFFVVWLNEEYPSHLFGVFEFRFHRLCFAFLFAASDIHISSRREVVCFLVSLPLDHVYPSGCLSFSRTNIVNPVHASDTSFLHPRSSNLQHFLQQYIQSCVGSPGNVDFLQ